jgi:hypothetical protein
MLIPKNRGRNRVRDRGKDIRMDRASKSEGIEGKREED